PGPRPRRPRHVPAHRSRRPPGAGVARPRRRRRRRPCARRRLASVALLRAAPPVGVARPVLRTPQGAVRMTVVTRSIPSPVGHLLLVGDGQCLHGLFMTRQHYTPSFDDAMEAEDSFAEAARQLDEWFEG